MNPWAVMLALGLLTFLTRLSFIAALERFSVPEGFRHALRFVPIAVLSAIIAPELAAPGGTLALSVLNPRLLAGLVATAVAYRTRSVIWTILAGMGTLWLLQLFL